MRSDEEEFISFKRSVSTSIDSHINDYESTQKAIEFLDTTARHLRKRAQKYEQYGEKNRRRRKLTRFLMQNILAFTILLQVICVLAIELIDQFLHPHINDEANHIFLSGVSVMVIFQVSNLILVISGTVKLTKQYKHRTVTKLFLLKSYLSTVLLFAGVYTLFARVRPSWFLGLRGASSDRYYSASLFSQLLFLSVSTGSLCGSASVTALNAFTELMMSFQMMLSFVYFTSILSECVNPSPPLRYKSKKKISFSINSHENVKVNDYGSTNQNDSEKDSSLKSRNNLGRFMETYPINQS